MPNKALEKESLSIPIPIWNRYLLTIEEAVTYYHIGENKIRSVLDEHPEADFLIMNGNRFLIKKQKFEEFLENVTVL